MSESYWLKVMQSGMRVPADRSLDEATVDLVDMLGSPNPRWREDLAYPLLATWIGKGVYDDVLAGLGDGLTPGLEIGLGTAGDLAILRRSYSALLLAEVIDRDNSCQLLPATTVLAWGDRAASWYVRERDERAWLPEHGWAYAIVHGADLLSVLARSRHFGRLELTVLLDVIADRALTATSYPWRHAEADHLAFAIMTVLHRNALDLAMIEPWLARLGAGIRQPRMRGHADAEWPTPAAHNASTLLRALHLQLVLGVQGRSDLSQNTDLFTNRPEHRANILLAVLDQLQAQSPWLYRPTASGPSIE